MPGENFGRGYACRLCTSIGIPQNNPDTPMYKRVNQRYIYSGYVYCKLHGIQKGIPMKKIKQLKENQHVT